MRDQTLILTRNGKECALTVAYIELRYRVVLTINI